MISAIIESRTRLRKGKTTLCYCPRKDLDDLARRADRRPVVVQLLKDFKDHILGFRNCETSEGYIAKLKEEMADPDENK